jgi:nitronate monooxygenase
MMKRNLCTYSISHEKEEAKMKVTKFCLSSSKFLESFKGTLSYPIIQGPMSGGATTPELVATVSEAGGLGSIGAGMSSPETIKSQVEEIRKTTSKPFAINLFIQKTPNPKLEEINEGIKLLKPLLKEIGLENLQIPSKWCEDFESQFETVLELNPPVASFTFGILNTDQMKLLHQRNIYVIGTATHLAEAGGHRGTFIGRQESHIQTSLELLMECRKNIKVPLISAGNIMTGEDVAYYLSRGASAVQLGTAFLVTHESGIHPAYKELLLNTKKDTTQITRGITGRLARGLKNKFIEMMKDDEMKVPAYPVQNALTMGIRSAAAKSNNTEFMSLWCGQGISRARSMRAKELIQDLVPYLTTENNC